MVTGEGLVVELPAGFHAVLVPSKALKQTSLPLLLPVIKERSICRNGKVVTPTSAMQRRSEIRQLPEDRHLCGDAWVFQK